MSQTNTVARDQPAARPGAAAPGETSQRQARRTSLLRPILMLGGTLALALGVLLFWLQGGQYVSSDDSYVEAAKVSLSTDVSGLVGKVYVHDNQHVQAGETLFSLDPANFGIAVANARAQLAQAVLDINAAKRGYAEALAQIAAQHAQLAEDQTNLQRYAAVVGNGGVTRATYDNARYTVQASQAQLAQLEAAAGLQLAKLSGDADTPVEQMPEYRTALAALNSALVAQRHSVVHAPFSGYVTNVDQLQPGMYLSAGTAAFGLVSDDHIWVTAQPKEDELTWVRLGQPVSISDDTYPGQTWRGVVESLSPASGSEFSLLPAQNSSGNWVKVVQRIPVRIKVLRKEGDPPLRAGMSVIADIDTGHKRSWRDLF
ncbi:MAG TPA: HlyD family secretion protein [Acidisoma sp.]|uniref:HlyD family secretion protein n=1 Tax=Acidisoma sp. TaxID=1872115 RepID=UPI002CB814E9|nr:HlyD family secretion protein [Acidisoma sp.]HTI01651.1 HlyD family secretion protein [Acidisoma sp.]